MTYKVSTTQITETVTPVVEPVSLAEARAHLREPDTTENTLIDAMITAARQYVETRTQSSLVQRTYRADVPGFAYDFELPYPPLSSISSIKYYTPDSPQVLTTLDAAVYRANLGKSIIYMDASSASTASTATRHDAVQVTYVAGYEPTTDSPIDYAGNVPNALKAAILLIVGDLFERRSQHSELRVQKLDTVDMLIAGYIEL